MHDNMRTRNSQLPQDDAGTSEDTLDFAESFISAILADAYDDLIGYYGFSDYHRDVVTCCRRIRSEGVHFVAILLPQLGNYLLETVEYGHADLSGFKIRHQLPRFLGRLFQLVTSESNMVPVAVQARAFDAIYSVTSAFKKLRGSPDDRDNACEKTYYSFVDVDKEIGDIDFDSDDLKGIIDVAAREWYKFARDININDAACVPRPGPGAVVNDHMPSTEPYMRYAPYVTLDTVDDVMPWTEWFLSHPWDVVSRSRECTALYRNKPIIAYSQYLIVPKTFVKWRGICKEFNEVQFRQQAVRALLYHHIEQKLGNNIPIRDQFVHRDRALRSSVLKDDATIDESEASDRIARVLVERIAARTPDFLRVLLALSTRFIKPPTVLRKKYLLSTHKFAPMGSAICFPVMSLVHLFLIWGIIHDKTDLPNKQDLCRRVSVYGDDIILPSELIPSVYAWLPRFGMKINRTKSYFRSGFRESCGCHAFNGRDVTPLYVKFTYSSKSDASPTKRLVSLLSLENQAHYKGLAYTASFLRSYLQLNYGLLPYVDERSAVVGFRRRRCDVPPNMLRDERSYDKNLQCRTFRVQCWVTIDRRKGEYPTEEERYLAALTGKKRIDVRYRLDDEGLQASQSPLEDLKSLADAGILYTKYQNVPASTLATF